AAEAFRLCLRYSPESTLAHLQLAMLYEDHLNDLPRAIVHYQEYLNAGVHDNEAAVAKWLERAERRHWEALAERFGEIKAPEPPIADSESAPLPAGLPPPVATAVYTVEAGDSLSGISKKLFGTTRHWELLYQMNAADIPDPARLSIGQQLKVPETTDE
ncbi:MAG: LysM domain-containing protein, partial [Lentisphaeria bacterium]|nr:LysM domain-containing protein [Lentisphaeria bacterium]